MIRFKINTLLFNVLAALYFSFILNLSFWKKMMEAVSAEEMVSAGFIASLPLAMFAIFYIAFTILSLIRAEKILIILLLPLGAIANFGMLTYGIQIDNNMIANIMETTAAESSSYFNLEFILWFILTGILPMLFVFFTKIVRPTFKKEIATKFLSLAAIGIIVAGFGALYSLDYMTIMRNNKGIEKQLVPSYFLSSTVKYFKHKYINDKIPFTEIGTDAAIKPTAKSAKKDVMVFILGETARGQNYELNGYPRPTNAHTRDLGVISFQNAASCGTATAVSVPCLFSFMGREKYEEKIAKKQSNVMDILSRVGIPALWVENDEGCKGVCDRIPTIITDKSVDPFCDGQICRDDYLLRDIDAQINAMIDTGGVIVLHIMGSHGPTYYKRYPVEHAAFKPDCPRSDVQNCSGDEIVNTYDNTILYTDFIMAEIIKKLQSHAAKINPALLYVSDHGESLGENGVYLHGMPYAIAPEKQTQVPLIFWTTPKAAKDKNIDLGCLKDRAKTEDFSHDFISHSLLGYMSVTTELYRPELDLFKPCKT